MNRLPFAEEEKLAEVGPRLRDAERAFGFLPSSFRTMANRPDIAEAFLALRSAIFKQAVLPEHLKRLIALATSRAAGCVYCQAHTASRAAAVGAEDKVDALWDFETSDLFDDSERAALRYAIGAGSQPNGVTDAMVDDIVVNFGVEGATEIAAICSMFGFLNRWNDSLNLTPEEDVTLYAERAREGWS